MDHLSQRGRSNIVEVMSKVPKSLLEDSKSKSSETDRIDLSVAENWLIRNEILEICKSVINQRFQTHHLNWPEGFWGNSDLLEGLAQLFNTYFHPQMRVTMNHISVAPGSAFALDALLYNICDPGEGVLVPTPYWNGYNVFLKVRAAVTLIPVTTLDFRHSLTALLIPALEEAFESAGIPVKALVIANPHNPLGMNYPKQVLEACLQFCQRRNLHFISDEVFALSVFKSADHLGATPFSSALALDPPALGCDPWRIHIIWSMSKDFGCSGIKIGCTVTQSNDNLRNGLALAAHMNVSTLSAVFAAELLATPRLPALIELNSTRLSIRYDLLKKLLDRYGINYVPCNAGTFVLARIAPHAESWEDEDAFLGRLRQAGVIVGSGRTYHVPEKGWARICFAIEDCRFQEAVRRMEGVFAAVKSANLLPTPANSENTTLAA